MSDVKVMMERLNNCNWASWKFRMELMLVKEGLWAVVSEPKPDDAGTSWSTKDASARAMIGLALDDCQLSHVIDVSTANEMWLRLKGYHERGSLCNKIHVLRKLCSLRLAEEGDMSKHLTEVANLVHRLQGMGEKLGEHWIVAILLSSLPETYNPLIAALEGRPEEELKMEYVKGKLLDEWRRRCEKEEENEAKALRTAFQRAEVGNRTEYIKRECFHCHREGHIRRDCPMLTTERRDSNDRRQREDDSATGSSWRGSRGHVCFTTTTVDINMSDGWLIDSGCTKHMTGDIGNLTNVSRRREEVCLADGKKISVRASGAVEFSGRGRNDERVDVKLKEVLYAPGLEANVISVSKMVAEGYTVSFKSGSCWIARGDRVVLVGEKRGGLFHLCKLRM